MFSYVLVAAVYSKNHFENLFATIETITITLSFYITRYILQVHTALHFLCRNFIVNNQPYQLRMLCDGSKHLDGL